MTLHLSDKQFEDLQSGKPVSKSKNLFGAIRTDCNFGHSHPSKIEAHTCNHLNFRQRGGEIRELMVGPSFNLIVNGQKVGRYTADFSFWDVAAKRRRVVDVKGKPTMTTAVRLRLALMRACLGIEVEIWDKPR